MSNADLAGTRAEMEAANCDLEPRLTQETAALARGHDAVRSFVNDRLDIVSLGILEEVGVRVIVLRSARYDDVDLASRGRAHEYRGGQQWVMLF